MCDPVGGQNCDPMRFTRNGFHNIAWGRRIAAHPRWLAEVDPNPNGVPHGHVCGENKGTFYFKEKYNVPFLRLQINQVSKACENQLRRTFRQLGYPMLLR